MKCYIMTVLMSRRTATIVMTAIISLVILNSLYFVSIPQCYAEQDRKFVYSKDKVLLRSLPKSPVKIKLKRSNDGDYSWEITGDDAGAIIRNNKMLEDKLNK